MKGINNITQLLHLRQLESKYGITRTTVDIQQLSEALCCTTRNVAKIMNSLAALEWVFWKPGRGRGIKSRMQIMYTFEALVCHILSSMVEKGELAEAYRHAEIFHYQAIFKQKLPEWLTSMPNNLERSDELISLVQYPLPHCHPVYMKDLHAGVYMNALFDTLIKFDPISKGFTAHLAHQFYQEGNTHYFRIRPDVYFHNGELLTPQHIKNNLLVRQKSDSITHKLFSTIEKITINLQWVEVTLTYDDPIFLHAISAFHSGIFLNNPDEQHYPFGTGGYQWDSLGNDHWSVVKNRYYFGLHGILKRADFWHVDKITDTDFGHLQQKEEQISLLPPKEGAHKIKGCKALCLNHHLEDSQREAFALLVKHVAKNQFGQSKMLCDSLLDVTLSSFDSSVDIDDAILLQRAFNHLTETTVKAFCYWSANEQEIRPLLTFMINNGIAVVPVDTLSKADFWLNDFLYGNNLLLNHYYWLLCSKSTEQLISSFDQMQWLSQIKNSDDLSVSLGLIEKNFITKHRVVPLWVKSVSLENHETLRGVDIDSLGLISLSDIWFDKRSADSTLK